MWLSFSLSSTPPIAPLADVHGPRNFSVKMFAVRSIGLLLCSGGTGGDTRGLRQSVLEVRRQESRRDPRAGISFDPLVLEAYDFTPFLFDVCSRNVTANRRNAPTSCASAPIDFTVFENSLDVESSLYHGCTMEESEISGSTFARYAYNLRSRV